MGLWLDGVACPAMNWEMFGGMDGEIFGGCSEQGLIGGLKVAVGENAMYLGFEGRAVSERMGVWVVYCVKRGDHEDDAYLEYRMICDEGCIRSG